MNIIACSIDGCEKKPYARTWCNPHYRRWLKYGDPNGGNWIPSGTDRFWSKVSKSSSCWEWNSTINDRGYGVYRLDGRMVRAHRLAYEMRVGSIPEGLVLDHTCHNRSCVNPDHLRPVTNKQNIEHRNGPNRDNKTSGILGVSWHKRKKLWRTSVTHHGTRHYCGEYSTRAEAEAAVISKRNELFTHNDMDRRGEVSPFSQG